MIFQEFPDGADTIEIPAGLSNDPFRQVGGAAGNRMAAALYLIEHNVRSLLTTGPSESFDGASVVRIFVRKRFDERVGGDAIVGTP